MKQFLMALLVLGVVGCSGQQSSNAPASTAPMESPSAMPAATTMATSMAMSMQSLTIPIKAQNGSGENGTATLTAMGAQTRIVIALKGEPAAGNQPAHVHLGSCAKLNPVPKYPLKNVIGGASNSVIAVPFAALTAGGMAINVHKAATAINVYVACGDIKAKTTM